MKPGCIFCKIVRRQADAKVVYEDELAMAFLDIHPASEGHTLIIPKEHYETLYDIPEVVLERLVSVAKEIAQLYKSVLNTRACNLLHASGKDAQQSIPHFHFHLVPRHKGDGLNLWYEHAETAKANRLDLMKVLDAIHR